MHRILTRAETYRRADERRHDLRDLAPNLPRRVIRVLVGRLRERRLGEPDTRLVTAHEQLPCKLYHERGKEGGGLVRSRDPVLHARVVGVVGRNELQYTPS